MVYSQCPKEVALSIFFDLVRGRTHALDETVQKRIMAYHGKAGRSFERIGKPQAWLDLSTRLVFYVFYVFYVF